MESPTGPEKIKKGWRQGTEKRQLSFIVNFRVNEQERAELRAAAERAGLTLGSYVRERVLSAPKTRAVRRPPIEKVLLAQLLGQLGRVGGNIHQIVKHMNFGSGVMHDELRSALTSFEEAAAAIMDAMGRKKP